MARKVPKNVLLKNKIIEQQKTESYNVVNKHLKAI